MPVSLPQLLIELERGRPPRAAEVPFAAVLDGEHPVIVTAVLERTAVYASSGTPPRERCLASHSRLSVDPAQVRTRELPFDPRTAAAARGPRAVVAAEGAADALQSVPATAMRLRQPSSFSHGGRPLSSAHAARIDELRPLAVIGQRVLDHFGLPPERREQPLDLLRDLEHLAYPLVEHAGQAPPASAGP